MLWDKNKEKAEKMLRLHYIAKGLAKQNQQAEQSDANIEKCKT